jgi:hypothetical protein
VKGFSESKGAQGENGADNRNFFEVFFRLGKAKGDEG